LTYPKFLVKPTLVDGTKISDSDFILLSASISGVNMKKEIKSFSLVAGTTGYLVFTYNNYTVYNIS